MLGILTVLISTATATPVYLKDGVGKDLVYKNCQICHSLEYVQMNAKFLGEKGWAAEVQKMIGVYGAPVPAADVPALIKYLSINY